MLATCQSWSHAKQKVEMTADCGRPDVDELWIGLQLLLNTIVGVRASSRE